MRTSEFYSMLKSLGIPVAYSAFKSTVDFPYCVYEEHRDIRGDDFKNRIIEAGFRIELYDAERNVELEQKLEQMLDERGLEYGADYGIYIEDDQSFMTVYEVEPISYKK